MMNPRMEKKQIKDVMSLTTDLFGYINYDLTELEITDAALNFYFMSKYSNRWVSPVLELLMDDEGEISVENFTVLGNYLNQLYAHKWDKLKDLLTLEYDPIHNYSDTMSEEITDNDDKSVTLDLDGTTSNTRTDNTTRTDNLTRTDDLEQTREVETTDDRSDSLYGFNSSDAVPSNEKTGAGSVDETDTQTGTVRNTGTVTNTGTVGNSGTNTIDSTESIERDYTRERSVTHVGNIGNISTQNLLGQEVEFWQWNFIIQMLSDVADAITLPIY